MDGIVQDAARFDAGLSGEILTLAAGATIVLVGLLGLAVAGEILRRTGVAPTLLGRLDRVVPAGLRRIVATLLTFSVTLLGPATAHAHDAPIRGWLAGEAPTTTSTATTTTTPVATEERLIERASPPSTRPSTTPSTTPTGPTPVPVAPVPSPPAPPSDRTPSAARHVVVAGECLWSIAASLLAPDATNRAIDTGWRAIYAVNRGAIGDNPSLIFPGLELELPPFAETPAATP